MKLLISGCRLHAKEEPIIEVFLASLLRIFNQTYIKMRKIICLLVFLSMAGIAQLSAQRIAIVDITKVLEELPDYKSAQGDLDKLAADWRQEIALQYDQIKAMYNKYQAEQVLLTEDAKKAKEDEIMEREKSVRDMQREKFGPEGALFRKRQDLVQPIQERVYAAIQKYAEDRGFDFIFDKGGTGGLIFSNAEYDKTEDVIRLLSK